jgi:two-component system KDP operon response regulator KdpE
MLQKNRRRSAPEKRTTGVALFVGVTAGCRRILKKLAAQRKLQTASRDDGGRGLHAARAAGVCVVFVAGELKDMPVTLFCEELRAQGYTGPLLCVSRGASLKLERAVLEAGADDFVPRAPVSRLIVRAEATMRRGSGTYTTLQRFGPLVIDWLKHEVVVDAVPVHFTPSELRVLGHLVMHRYRVVPTNEIGQNLYRARHVKRHVSAMRSKLGAAGRAIQTVRGWGYRFNAGALA